MIQGVRHWLSGQRRAWALAEVKGSKAAEFNSYTSSLRFLSSHPGSRSTGHALLKLTDERVSFEQGGHPIFLLLAFQPLLQWRYNPSGRALFLSAFPDLSSSVTEHTSYYPRASYPSFCVHAPFLQVGQWTAALRTHSGRWREGRLAFDGSGPSGY